MSTELWPHQVEALRWLRDHRNAYLHIDMGGGKTRIIIEHIARNDFQRTLIVCPKSVVPVWPAELAKWWPKDRHLTVYAPTNDSISKRARELQQLAPPWIFVTNYDAYWREPLRKAIVTARPDLVVYDEAHRLKSPGGKASLFAALLRQVVPNRIALSGTPIPHSPLDIYAQFRALDVSIFGKSFAVFRARYAIMGGYQNRQIIKFIRLDELAFRMRAIMFQASIDYLKLPEGIDTLRYCYLERSARELYDALEAELIAYISTQQTVSAQNVLVKVLRLQQITSGTVPTDEGATYRASTAKRDLLADLLQDLPPEEPVVVFCRFHTDLDDVHAVAAATGRKSLELSGRVNQLADWHWGNAPILAMQLRAGSLGLDLTKARYAIFYSLPWSLGEYQQARARLVRPGQTRAVTFVHLLVADTIDEVILHALNARADVVEVIINYLKEGGHDKVGLSRKGA